jgi:hypothetical protein
MWVSFGTRRGAYYQNESKIGEGILNAIFEKKKTKKNKKNKKQNP